jgi:hypothetical protein
LVVVQKIKAVNKINGCNRTQEDSDFPQFLEKHGTGNIKVVVLEEVLILVETTRALVRSLVITELQVVKEWITELQVVKEWVVNL